jgi:pimeloyl-ACP methyl ester carboxylesterase
MRRPAVFRTLYTPLLAGICVAAAGCGPSRPPPPAAVGGSPAAVRQSAALPSRNSTVSAGGTTLAYRDTTAPGADPTLPPIVLIHGTLLNLDSWTPQWADFAGQRRTITYSRRHHTPNPRMPDSVPYDAAQHADDLAELLRTLDAAPTDLVGASYGGLVALLTAIRHPDVVHALVLAEPAVMGLLGDSGRAAALQLAAGPRARLAAGDSLGMVAVFVDRVLGAEGAYAGLPEDLQRDLAAERDELARELTAPVDRWMPLLTCAEVATVKAPTLVLLGERGSPRFARMASEITRCIPGSTTTVVPAAGHAMSMDNPAAFNRIVLDFLAAAR